MKNNNELIDTKVTELLSLDISTTNPDEIQERLDEISVLFGGEVPSSSHYFSKIEEFYKKINAFHTQKAREEARKIKSEGFKQGKREYVGAIVCAKDGEEKVSKLIVKPVYDHFFISRVYTNKTDGRGIKVSWRFNRNGKIELIDGLIFPENRITHMLTIPRYIRRRTPDYKETDAYYRWIPEARLINPGIGGQPLRQKVQSILRFGHKMSRDLIEKLSSGDVRDSYRLVETQKQLREIEEDCEALFLLEQASRRVPSVKSDANGIYVCYDSLPFIKPSY